MESKKFFPIFKKCDKALVIVFGGGKIALRRTLSLLNFDVKLKIISPHFNEGFDKLKQNENVELIVDVFNEKYITTCFFVLACTNDDSVNKNIVNFCKEKNIDVNSASNKEDCTFYFPYLIHENEITIAITGSGNSHKKTKKTGDEIKEFLGKRSDFY